MVVIILACAESFFPKIIFLLTLSFFQYILSHSVFLSIGYILLLSQRSVLIKVMLSDSIATKLLVTSPKILYHTTKAVKPFLTA